MSIHIGWISWLLSDVDGQEGTCLDGYEIMMGNWLMYYCSYMATNCWIGNYYLGSNGKMLTNTTTPDGYKVGEDGAWIPNDAEYEVRKNKEFIDNYNANNPGLQFIVKAGTLVDCGNYYQADAVYCGAILAPSGLKDGDIVSLVVNDITGETEKLRFKNGSFFELDDDNIWGGVMDGKYGYASPWKESYTLYEVGGCDVRANKPVYEGKLFIRKDATKEYPIVGSVNRVTPEIINYDELFDEVHFDKEGYVTRLIWNSI